jgi:hypothetical protein
MEKNKYTELIAAFRKAPMKDFLELLFEAALLKQRIGL